MLERLQKIIARAGIASRRHAEELIRSGQVSVNGVVITELGSKADPDHDRIEAAGRAVEQAGAATYYILNKPPHVVATMSDPEGRATLRHLLRGLAGGLFPVGRLDYAASGLILLTSDGQLANSMFKVSPALVKVYWMKVKDRPTQETLSKVGHKAQARLRLLRAPGASAGRVENPWYEAELRDPRRDLLRQAFFEAGHPVEKVKRVRLGPLELGDLPEGQYRQLAPSEVEALRRAVERAAEPGNAPIAPPVNAPVAVRNFERKKWRAAAAARPSVPQGGGKSDRGFVPRPPGDRSSPAQPGKPAWTDRPAARSGQSQGGERRFPPRSGQGGQTGERRFPPRGERGTGSTGERRFPPRGKFAGKPGAPAGGAHRPGQPFHRGDGGKPRDEDRGSSRGPWRGERPGQSRGERPSGPPRGDRPAGPPRGDRPSGPPRGDRPFRAGGDRGSRPFGRDKFSGSKSGPPRSGDRRPGQTFHRNDGGKPRGDRPSGPPRGDRKPGSGKFVPRGPRAGAPPSGKFRGKPAHPGGFTRPGGPARPGKPGRPGGSGRSGGPNRSAGRPGGKPFNSPGGRPPRRPSGPKSFPPREDE